MLKRVRRFSKLTTATLNEYCNSFYTKTIRFYWSDRLLDTKAIKYETWNKSQHIQHWRNWLSLRTWSNFSHFSRFIVAELSPVQDCNRSKRLGTQVWFLLNQIILALWCIWCWVFWTLHLLCSLKNVASKRLWCEAIRFAVIISSVKRSFIQFSIKKKITGNSS